MLRRNSFRAVVASERVERKLAAILAADVVGYSRLTCADEEGTMRRLRSLRAELIDPAVQTNRGRVFHTAGDSILIEFASVVDAVRCAVEVQRGTAARNGDLVPENQIEFRVGIHLGDVMVQPDGDLLGDGINIAARLEGIAEPGGACLSEDAYRQVRDKIAGDFIDLGEKQLKNISRPVRVYGLGIRAAAQTAELPRPTPGLPDKPSIAVLPFQNMSNDPEQEYFADGMVEDIITGLSRIRWLSVIARNSSFTYKGRAVDVKRIGQELGVRYVLEGSVRKAANRIRITGQLIEAETGAHLWAERYDRTLDDIFALQDDITLSTIGAIEPSLRVAEIERVKRKRPENLDAYDLVLRAMPHVTKAMPDEARIAVPLLERALSLEPNYALAHGYLAWCYETLYMRDGLEPKIADAAITHAKVAMTHGRDDATALAAAGFAFGMVGHDWQTAVDAFEGALALSPSCGMALMFGSVVMGWANEPERAIEWGERGLRLSPFDPQGFGAISASHSDILRGHTMRRQ